MANLKHFLRRFFSFIWLQLTFWISFLPSVYKVDVSLLEPQFSLEKVFNDTSSFRSLPNTGWNWF